MAKGRRTAFNAVWIAFVVVVVAAVGVVDAVDVPFQGALRQTETSNLVADQLPLSSIPFPTLLSSSHHDHAERAQPNQKKKKIAESEGFLDPLALEQSFAILSPRWRDVAWVDVLFDSTAPPDAPLSERMYLPPVTAARQSNIPMLVHQMMRWLSITPALTQPLPTSSVPFAKQKEVDGWHHFATHQRLTAYHAAFESFLAPHRLPSHLLADAIASPSKTQETRLDQNEDQREDQDGRQQDAKDGEAEEEEEEGMETVMVACWSDMPLAMREALHEQLLLQNVPGREKRRVRLDVYEFPLNPLTMRPDELAMAQLVQEHRNGILFFNFENAVSGKIHMYEHLFRTAKTNGWRIMTDATAAILNVRFTAAHTKHFDAIIVDWAPAFLGKDPASLPITSPFAAAGNKAQATGMGEEEHGAVSLFLRTPQFKHLSPLHYHAFAIFPNEAFYLTRPHPFVRYLKYLTGPLYGLLKSVQPGASLLDALITRQELFMGFLASVLTEDELFRFRTPDGQKDHPMFRIAGGYNNVDQAPAMALLMHASDGQVLRPHFVQFICKRFQIDHLVHLAKGDDAIGAVRHANPNTLGWGHAPVVQQAHPEGGTILFYPEAPDVLGHSRMAWSNRHRRYEWQRSTQHPPLLPASVNVLSSLPTMTFLDVFHLLRVFRLLGTHVLFDAAEAYMLAYPDEPPLL